MENGCAGWGCPPNRKLAVFGQFLVGGGGSKGEGLSERFPAEFATVDNRQLQQSQLTTASFNRIS